MNINSLSNSNSLFSGRVLSANSLHGSAGFAGSSISDASPADDVKAQQTYGEMAGAQAMLANYRGAAIPGVPQTGASQAIGAAPTLNGAQALPPGSAANGVQSADASSGGDLSGQAVGFGHFVGLRIDAQQARAQQMAQSGQISQDQLSQITQDEQGVSSQLESDDASDNGKKLSKGDFSDADSQLVQDNAILDQGASGAAGGASDPDDSSSPTATSPATSAPSTASPVASPIATPLAGSTVATAAARR